jgi:cytosine/adenosine deaminase-related metal-dependent hydrolase
VDAIKHGTTTLIDHHASPSAIDSSLDQIADAVERPECAPPLCYEVTDRNGPAGAAAGIGENVRFAHAVAERGGDLLAGDVRPARLLSLSDRTLERCVAAAQGVGLGFHIHVAEHEADEYDAREQYGRRVIDRLAKRWASSARAALSPTASTSTRGRWNCCARRARG